MQTVEAATRMAAGDIGNQTSWSGGARAGSAEISMALGTIVASQKGIMFGLREEAQEFTAGTMAEAAGAYLAADMTDRIAKGGNNPLSHALSLAHVRVAAQMLLGDVDLLDKALCRAEEGWRNEGPEKKNEAEDAPQDETRDATSLHRDLRGQDVTGSEAPAETPEPREEITAINASAEASNLETDDLIEIQANAWTEDDASNAASDASSNATSREAPETALTQNEAEAEAETTTTTAPSTGGPVNENPPESKAGADDEANLAATAATNERESRQIAEEEAVTSSLDWVTDIDWSEERYANGCDKATLDRLVRSAQQALLASTMRSLDR